MTETSPEQRHERMADQVEDTCDWVFDPLATMDAVKWREQLLECYPWWLPSDRATVADILEARHFKGFV